MSDTDELSTEVPVARRSRHDLIFGTCVTGLAVLLALWVIPAGVQVPESVTAPPLSPAFLPYVLTALIGLLGIVCLLQATIGSGVPKEDSELNFHAANSWPVRLVLILAAFAAFWILPDVLGMLTVAIVVMGMLVFAGGERNILRGVLVSVLIPFGVWLFFTRVAQVPLPEGILEGLIPS